MMNEMIEDRIREGAAMAFDFFHRGRSGEKPSVDPGRVPPGQVVTQKWPVLHYGGVPRVDLATWNFQVTGRVGNRFTLSWEEFHQLPRVSVHCDIHCVTRWSRLENTFEGVAFKTLNDLAAPK